MIKVLYGNKGLGKTKILVDTVNELAKQSSGDIVFIDDSNELMYGLDHKIRFINVTEFPVEGSSGFIGFISGIISEDYDIDSIFIDRLTYIVKQQASELDKFFAGLKNLSEKYNINFYLSVNGDSETIPEFLKEFGA
jgi:hypothetical protein